VAQPLQDHQQPRLEQPPLQPDLPQPEKVKPTIPESDRQLRQRKETDYKELHASIKSMPISKTKSKSGGNQTGTWGPFSAASRSTASKKVIMVNLLFLAAFFAQTQYSDAETRPPILIDSEFTQPEKLQLSFCPMGKYAASTFTSHIHIHFNYSSLMDLQ
jgi:hypothetical protein